LDDEESEILSKADTIRTKIALRKNESRLTKKSLKNRAIIPRTKTRKRFSQLESHLSSLGLDHSRISARTRTGFQRGEGEIAMLGEDVVMRDAVESTPNEVQIFKAKMSRATSGLKNQSAVVKTEGLRRARQVGRNRDARQGEADRRIAESKPKHMYVGKRKMGKTNRR
jgi:nucleolar GTP-binding protein